MSFEGVEKFQSCHPLQECLTSSVLLEELVKQCETFQQHVKKVKNLLSRNILFSMTCLAMEILILLCAIPSIVINLVTYGNTHPIGIMNLFTTTFYILMLIFYVYSFNITAENVTNKVDDLKDLLKDVYVPLERSTENLDGKIVPMSFMKSRIEDKLANFEGFSGQGYFILGKSFLKNLLAFCITYFVILLQFKISEVSSEVPDSEIVEITNNSIVFTNITEF